MLKCCRDSQILLKTSKCCFGKRELDFLGHKVSRTGLAPQFSKLTAMSRMQRPTDLPTLRSAMGFFSYYRKFVPNFSQLAPLIELTRKGARFVWEAPQEAAWQRIRRALSQPIELAPFQAGSENCVILSVDASSEGFGAVLSQNQEGKRVPIMFFSRTASPAESRYSNTERELRAVVYGLEELGYFTAGRKVIVETDHGALVSLLKRKRDTGHTTPCCVRLRARLDPWIACGLEIVHINGTTNPADVWSRITVASDAGSRIATTRMISTIELAVRDKLKCFFSEEDFIKAQANDPNCREIRKFLSEQKKYEAAIRQSSRTSPRGNHLVPIRG